MAQAAAVNEIPVRKRVSNEEWQTRVDLAACYRLVAKFGWSDLLATHISARVPGEPEHFLINPFGLMFEEITASSLLKVNEAGDVLVPSPFPFNQAGFVIHGAIHEARPEVNCVVHLHTGYGTAVSAQADGLLPLSQISMVCLPRLAYHDYEGVALDFDERNRLVADLGEKDLMLLRNHGTLACGETVADAWAGIYGLERACEVQVKAMSAERLNFPSRKAVETVAKQSASMSTKRSGSRSAGIAGGRQDDGLSYGQRSWPAMLRMLDRTDTSYRE